MTFDEGPAESFQRNLLTVSSLYLFFRSFSERLREKKARREFYKLNKTRDDVFKTVVVRNREMSTV